MKNRKCPSHKVYIDYDNGNCENCVFGETIIKLHKRIERLKKQNETLTIQRNAWVLAAKAVKADTVREMQERLTTFFTNDDNLEYNEVDADYVNEKVDQIAEEMLNDGD